jgi:hypothetical protein
MSTASLTQALAARASAARPARRRAAAVRCQAGAPEPAVSRRALAAGLLAVPALLAARPALALIPDDDDEECVPRASAGA